MAFSYSDKNFTVIGNLCFVHIILDSKTRMIDIPPAIVERILNSNAIFTYPYSSRKDSAITKGIGYAIISNSKIFLSDVGEGYLYCYFPIDSNK